MSMGEVGHYYGVAFSCGLISTIFVAIIVSAGDCKPAEGDWAFEDAYYFLIFFNSLVDSFLSAVLL